MNLFQCDGACWRLLAGVVPAHRVAMGTSLLCLNCLGSRQPLWHQLPFQANQLAMSLMRLWRKASAGTSSEIGKCSYNSAHVVYPCQTTWTRQSNGLNSLLQVLQRKPQMEKDYVHFMARIQEKGHTVPVLNEEM